MEEEIIVCNCASAVLRPCYIRGELKYEKEIIIGFIINEFGEENYDNYDNIDI